jgi:hypothetical protein
MASGSKRNLRAGIQIAGLLAVLTIATAAVFASSTRMRDSSVSGVAPDLLYFQGKWNITLKADPSVSFIWTVSQDLKGEWLSGVIEKNGERVSTDLWRVNAGIIERYVFTNEGVFIRLVSSGWKSGKLVLSGIGNGKAVDFRVRETVTRLSETRFKAVWERQGEDGKWTVTSEETCTK